MAAQGTAAGVGADSSAGGKGSGDAHTDGALGENSWRIGISRGGYPTGDGLQ